MANNFPQTLFNKQVVTNKYLTVDGKPYEVNRTWKERLFNVKPWRPFKKTRTIIPQVPSKEFLVAKNIIYCHPEMLKELQRLVKAYESRNDSYKW